MFADKLKIILADLQKMRTTAFSLSGQPLSVIVNATVRSADAFQACQSNTMAGLPKRARVDHGELVASLAALTQVSASALAKVIATLRDAGVELDNVDRHHVSTDVLTRCLPS